MPRTRKLRLNKSTVRRLEPQDMLEAVGGRPRPGSSDGGTCYYTCGSCDTLSPGGGCNDPTIANHCGETNAPCF